MAFYPRNIRIRHAKRRQLQPYIMTKSCPRPVTRLSAIMRLDLVVVGVVGVLDSFRADDCPRSRTWHMQLLETQNVKDFYANREISVIPANSRIMNEKLQPEWVISSCPRTLRFMVSHLLCNVWALHRFQLGSESVFQSISLSSRTCKESTLEVS
jgi:hypothetical protein